MIPLGILAAAGFVAPVVGGSYDLLSTQILTSNQASVTFASLGTYAADYQHLQLRMVAKSTASGSWADVARITLNSDTASKYRSHFLFGNGGSALAEAKPLSEAMDSILIAGSGNSANASVFGGAIVDFLEPFVANKNTTIRSLVGTVSIGSQIRLVSGAYFDTSSVTSISIASDAAANFVTGSRFSLYGLRKV